MLLHCFESDRARRRWATLPTCWSAGAHGALLASVVGVGPLLGLAPRTAAPERREAVYLLPMLPSAEALSLAPGTDAWRARMPAEEPEKVPERPLPGLPDAFDVAFALPDPVEEKRVEAMREDSLRFAGTPTFLVDATGREEQEVWRDPSSAGPAYPAHLREAGIEGVVLAEWIVDSTGRVAPATLRVVHASRPEFAEAVAVAVPRMRFRPATLGGLPVTQEVRQEFLFRLDFVPVAVGARATPAARRTTARRTTAGDAPRGDPDEGAGERTP
jgi:TonB family protein